MPKVSVIIPTYNCAHLVGQAVDSVLAQTCGDFEIIVVDDGSTDNTRQVLRSFGKIRTILRDHRGVAEARNVGIQGAAGEYVAFLDADDVWLPAKLELQVASLEEHPDTDVVYCDAYLADEKGQVFTCLHARHAGRILPHLLLKNVVTGSASVVMVRKACFEQVGLFDPALEALEDWDMWLRLAVHFRFGFVPQPLVKIRQQRISRTQTAGVEGYRQALEMIYHKLVQDPIARESLPNSERFIQAVIHINLGNCWLANYEGAAREARREFWAAIRIFPRIRHAYVGLFKSLIGTRLSQRAWRLKWGLIGLLQRRLAKRQQQP